MSSRTAHHLHSMVSLPRTAGWEPLLYNLLRINYTSDIIFNCIFHMVNIDCQFLVNNSNRISI